MHIASATQRGMGHSRLPSLISMLRSVVVALRYKRLHCTTLSGGANKPQHRCRRRRPETIRSPSRATSCRPQVTLSLACVVVSVWRVDAWLRGGDGSSASSCRSCRAYDAIQNHNTIVSTTSLSLSLPSQSRSDATAAVAVVACTILVLSKNNRTHVVFFVGTSFVFRVCVCWCACVMLPLDGGFSIAQIASSYQSKHPARISIICPHNRIDKLNREMHLSKVALCR